MKASGRTPSSPCSLRARTFRHRNVYVHADSGIEKPEDLRGRRVGTPGYGMSANTWIRGFLLDEYGVRADEMQWIETTKSSDARQYSMALATLRRRFPVPPAGRQTFLSWRLRLASTSPSSCSAAAVMR